jgi:hypothetical protein
VLVDGVIECLAASTDDFRVQRHSSINAVPLQWRDRTTVTASIVMNTGIGGAIAFHGIGEEPLLRGGRRCKGNRHTDWLIFQKGNQKRIKIRKIIRVITRMASSSSNSC